MQHSGTGWQTHVDNILFYAASQMRCITYAALAEQAQLPAPHRIHTLTGYLEILMKEDAEAKRPLRASVVISRAGQSLPANGFFMLCAELGLMTPDMDRRAFHQDCLSAMFDFARQQ